MASDDDQGREVDPVMGDRATAARWLVLVNREGVYDVRTFDDELAARESFDTLGLQWSDVFLCPIVRGPGPNPGQPGVLEPMFHELTVMRAQRDLAQKEHADLRLRIQAALDMPNVETFRDDDSVPPPPAPMYAPLPPITQTRDRRRQRIEVGDSVLLHTADNGPISPPRIELISSIDEGDELVLGTGERWPAADVSLAEAFDKYGNLVRVGDLILDGAAWIKVVGFWMLNEDDEVRARFEGGGGWRVSDLASRSPGSPIPGGFAKAYRKGEREAEPVAPLPEAADPPAVVAAPLPADPTAASVAPPNVAPVAKGPRDKAGRPVRVGDSVRVRGTKRWVTIAKIKDEHGTTWAILADGSSICIPTSETKGTAVPCLSGCRPRSGEVTHRVGLRPNIYGCCPTVKRVLGVVTNGQTAQATLDGLLKERDAARDKWLKACGLRAPSGATVRTSPESMLYGIKPEVYSDSSALVAWRVAIDMARHEYDDALDRLREFNREQAEKRLADERASHAAMEREWREHESRLAATEESRLAEQTRRDQDRHEMEIDRHKRDLAAQRQHEETQRAMILLTFIVAVGTIIQAFK